jgi:hypothetical protein
MYFVTGIPPLWSLVSCTFRKRKASSDAFRGHEAPEFGKRFKKGKTLYNYSENIHPSKAAVKPSPQKNPPFRRGREENF